MGRDEHRTAASGRANKQAAMIIVRKDRIISDFARTGTENGPTREGDRSDPAISTGRDHSGAYPRGKGNLPLVGQAV